MSGDKKQVVVISPMSTRRRQIRRTLDKISEAQLAGEGETSGEACFEARQATKIHVVVVDLAHPDSSTSSFWIEIHLAFPAARLLAVTNKPLNTSVLQAALHAGVYGYILWEHVPKTFHLALTEMCAGRPFYSDAWLILAVTSLTYRWMTSTTQKTLPSSILAFMQKFTNADKLERLTKSEQDVLWRLAEGLSNQEIAIQLCLSEKTIRNRISEILSKLGLKRRGQITAWLHQNQDPH